MTDYLREAQALFDYTQNLRRDFHRHPELGFQEVRTAGIVARELNGLGLEVTTGIAQTGVVAILEGARPGPVVLLRFDMDALPIQEQTGAEYASQNPGVMHACGHDAHTSIGLTVARLLHAHRQELAGTVKLVFQPAEEGLGGAARMIAEGVLANPRPDIALAMHQWPEKPVGWLGISDGPVMAASETFALRIRGRGGHGGMPDQTIDPIAAAAQVVSALQTIVSRNVSPLQAAVISVTAIHGGEAFNVIPPEVTLKGTIRTFDPGVRQVVLERFRQVTRGVSEALGCQAEAELLEITPAVVNDARVAGLLRQSAQRLLPEASLDAAYRTSVSEDMAFMLQETPGCFIFVGSANPAAGIGPGLHHPRFDLDEQVLPQAAALIAHSAADLLK
ncbi:MAG TPA: amidohydrolase [Anaerolineales bacterium]